jgi:predicted restriction endonuclease
MRKDAYKQNNCKFCNKLFTSVRYYKLRGKDEYTKYCSFNCYKLDSKGKRKSSLVQWYCKVCKKEKLLTFYYASIRKYCSNKCSIKINKEKLKIKKYQDILCKTCSKLIRPWHKYCSQKCYLRKGKNNPNYIDGRTPENHKIRNSLKYKIFRKKVFERDNYTCKICGEIGEKLNVHHIKPFSLFPELRFSIDNGMTLCIDCHKETDNYLLKQKKIC